MSFDPKRLQNNHKTTSKQLQNTIKNNCKATTKRLPNDYRSTLGDYKTTIERL